MREGVVLTWVRRLWRGWATTEDETLSRIEERVADDEASWTNLVCYSRQGIMLSKEDLESAGKKIRPPWDCWMCSVQASLHPNCSNLRLDRLADDH